MSHAKVRIWVHVVFATKYREAAILASIEKDVHRILFTAFKQAGCFIHIINGTEDHIHALVALNPKKAMADIMSYVKGGSSHSINQSGLLTHKFAWQPGYAAFSVSESKVELVHRYIRMQKQHHLQVGYADEIAWLERLHGLQDATNAS